MSSFQEYGAFNSRAIQQQERPNCAASLVKRVYPKRKELALFSSKFFPSSVAPFSEAA